MGFYLQEPSTVLATPWMTYYNMVIIEVYLTPEVKFGVPGGLDPSPVPLCIPHST